MPFAYGDRVVFNAWARSRGSESPYADHLEAEGTVEAVFTHDRGVSLRVRWDGRGTEITFQAGGRFVTERVSRRPSPSTGAWQLSTFVTVTGRRVRAIDVIAWI